MAEEKRRGKLSNFFLGALSDSLIGAGGGDPAEVREKLRLRRREQAKDSLAENLRSDKEIRRIEKEERGAREQKTKNAQTNLSNLISLVKSGATDAEGNPLTIPSSALEASGLGGLGDLTLPPKATTKPKPPPGFAFTNEGQRLKAIPGGPAALKIEEASRKTKARGRAAIEQSTRVIAKVDQALKKVGLFSAGPGANLRGLKGSKAFDLASDIQTIKANLGFAELQKMRESSKTGGALGAIAVAELEALQSTIASIEQGQSPAQLRARLGEIKLHLTNWRKAVRESLGRIRVRDKKSGRVGSVPSGKFDPKKHERI